MNGELTSEFRYAYNADQCLFQAFRAVLSATYAYASSEQVACEYMSVQLFARLNHLTLMQRQYLKLLGTCAALSIVIVNINNVFKSHSCCCKYSPLYPETF